MTSTMKRSTLKLPRLRTKDELLKTAPELARLLGVVVPEDTGLGPAPVRATSAHFGTKGAGSFKPANASPRNIRSAGHTMDTPRGLEEELTEEQLLQLELEEVKRERNVLNQSIVQARQEAGTAGGEAQQADIRQLMRELEMKKTKLNEMKQETRRKEEMTARFKDDNEDAERMCPGELSEQAAYSQHLKDEMTRIDEDLIEAEAKNRLYYLLSERTRRDHMAMDQQVRAARDLKNDCKDDTVTLTQHLNETRAAKEATERDLARLRKMNEEARIDWQKKLRERRKEVRELKKRQQQEHEKEVKRRERALEKERTEKEAAAKVKMEAEAYHMQVQALAPKIESMEAAWNRLRTISGADTPEDVIAYWEGLKAKEANMRELVKLAEQREAAAKEEIMGALDDRSSLLEAAQGNLQDAASSQEQRALIADAERRMEAARAKFAKLRAICIGAQQGLRSVQGSLMVALGEIAPESLRASYTKQDVRKHHDKAGATKKQSPASTPARRATPTSRDSKPGTCSTPDLEHNEATDTEAALLEDNSIDDDHFFPDLPDLLSSVAERLGTVLASSRPPTSPKGGAEEGEEEGEGLSGDECMSPSEKQLLKGLRRRTWTGAPWLEAIHPDTQLASTLPSMKRKKGKKREQGPQPDLTRILGYTGDDVDVDPPAAPSSEDEGEEGEWDGVVDRDFIKHRAVKMSARHAPVARV